MTRWIRLATLSAVALLTAPIFLMSFGCDDDTAVSVARSIRGSYFEAAWMAAVGWGRFYEVVAYNLAQIPFLVQSFWWTNSFRALALVSCLATFWLLIRTITGSQLLGALAVVLTSATMYTGPTCNPYHCYPLWFQPPLTLMFLSWTIYWRALEKGSRTFFWLSALTLFASLLFYESFILFTLGHFLIAYKFRASSTLGQWTVLGKVFRDLRAPLVVSVCYLAIYYGFQKIYPSSYPGSQLSFPPVPTYLKTLWRMTEVTVQFGPRHLIDSVTRLSQFNPVQWAYVALFVLVHTTAAVLAIDKVPVIAKPTIALLTALLFMFLPNAIYPLTGKYRAMAEQPLSEPYIGSFYSGFFLAVTLLVLISLPWFDGHRKLRRWTTGLGILYISFASSAYTAEIASSWVFNRGIWKQADLYLRYVKDSGRTSEVIYAPSFWEVRRLALVDDYDYWTHYYRLNLGNKALKVYRDASTVEGKTPTTLQRICHPSDCPALLAIWEAGTLTIVGAPISKALTVTIPIVPSRLITQCSGVQILQNENSLQLYLVPSSTLIKAVCR